MLDITNLHLLWEAEPCLNIKINSTWSDIDIMSIHTFRSRILEILQSGLNVYWHRRYQPAVSALDICQNRHESADLERSLKLENLAGAFLILAVGLTVSAVAFLLEIANYIYYNRSSWIDAQSIGTAINHYQHLPPRFNTIMQRGWSQMKFRWMRSFHSWISAECFIQLSIRGEEMANIAEGFPFVIVFILIGGKTASSSDMNHFIR